MTVVSVVGLFVASFAAGALNAVAGGGQFLTFPMLTFAGVPLINANATSSAAVWPASVASAIGYRQDVREQRQLLLPLGFGSVVGAIVGAIILIRTPQTTFGYIVPWLLLFATILLIFGGPLVARIRKHLGHSSGPTRGGIIVATIVQLLLGIYGGYFGGGIGFVILASMAFLGLENIHTMNGLKTILASCINGVAAITFLIAGVIAWLPAAIMLLGAIAGGYGGAFYARRLDPLLVRRFSIAVACAMTAYFFVRQYLLR
jgi:uncharacterized membrane protein YfcA